MVKCIHDNVGRTYRTLDEPGIRDRTLLVLTSDRGDLCYKHGYPNRGVPDERPACVPSLISPRTCRWPTMRQRHAGLPDLFRPLCGLLNLDFPGRAQFEGRDGPGWFLGIQPEARDGYWVVRSTSHEL